MFEPFIFKTHILNIYRYKVNRYEVNLIMLKSIFIAIFLFGLLLFQYILAFILVKRSENIVKMVQEIQEKVDKPANLNKLKDEEVFKKESFKREIPVDDREIIFEKELKLDNSTKEIEINIETDFK